MTVRELVDLLSALPDPTAKVALVDLNGLLWLMEPGLVREVDDLVVIGDKNINAC